MSRAAARLTAGFFLVLAVSVVQARDDWGVTYTSNQVCALKGSTVNISCTYTHPSTINDVNTTVEQTFWFTKWNDGEPVDLRADSRFSGRVQYHCHRTSCTVTVTDLRVSDSAVYKFRFVTNQPGGHYTGEPGVTLTVTALDVKVIKSNHYSTTATLECSSTCRLPGHTSTIWYKNEERTEVERLNYSGSFKGQDSCSCAVKGHEDLPSPSVCVHGDECNRLTYTHRYICAFEGSSVHISCTYHSYYRRITSKFWFRSDRSRYNDLSKDSQYSGHVRVPSQTGRSTLTITDLRETDSAQYHFTFNEWRSSLPGTTLTVTDPDVEVQVILSSVGPKLICHSTCLPPGHSFVWYKNEKKIRAQSSASYTGHVDPADSYSCAFEGYERYRSLPVYGPKVPLVSVSNPGDIMKDSSVTLTCSTDAKPAAKYSWYKKNLKLPNKEPQLVFRSIQSLDSGEYYCKAENELGRTVSEGVFINVKYGPLISKISVSPSAEIVEGSSVTLTCSSDANPAANYTWYKENQTLLQGPEGIYHFTPISSEDTGTYYCKSENQYKEINSTSLFLDVHYPPKVPSVSVSPSAEIVEGSSVTLTCSSDSNPAANYTWYKENEDSPKASGQIFTITDIRPEHSGNYSCEAQNTIGRQNSTLHLTVTASALKSAATVTAVLLFLILLLALLLWIRRKKVFAQRCTHAERPDGRTQTNMAPLYDTPSSAGQRQPAGSQDEPQYASISFSQTHTDAVYSNIRSARPHRQTQDEDEDEEEEDGVEYTAVKVDGDSCAPGTRNNENDSFAFYSTVNPNYQNTT